MSKRQPERSSENATRWRVLEVHNFGGFFGGDTVTLTASRWSDQVEDTITIDERALANVPDRHTVAPSMVFDLTMAGDRVDRADLLGAADWAVLDAALGGELPPRPLQGLHVRAYRCNHCGLWVAGEPVVASGHQFCRLCDTLLL